MLVAAALLALPAPEAGGARGPAALAAWPARVVVVAPGRTTLHLDNPGTQAAVVETGVSGYALDARGRPRVQIGGAAGGWLSVRPRRVVVPPGAKASLSVRVLRPPTARHGDHAFVVLLTTRLPTGPRVLAHLRIGVVVVVRIPGAALRRLTLGRVTARRAGGGCLLDVAVANPGDVDEWIGRQRLSVVFFRGARRLATVRAAPRRLLARTRGIVSLRCPRSLRGRLTAVVGLTQPETGRARVTEKLALRL